MSGDGSGWGGEGGDGIIIELDQWTSTRNPCQTSRVSTSEEWGGGRGIVIEVNQYTKSFTDIQAKHTIGMEGGGGGYIVIKRYPGMKSILSNCSKVPTNASIF